jgi:hypothetical protein
LQRSWPRQDSLEQEQFEIGNSSRDIRIRVSRKGTI